MSSARNAMLTSTNASTQRHGSSHQRLSSRRRAEAALFAAGIFVAPQLLGDGLDFDGVFEQRVVAVPLREIGAPHERTVLGRPSVVMPEVKIFEIERRLKRLIADQSV